MIIASDGIWDFIESVDVVKIIAPFYEQGNIEGTCDFLLGVVLRRWQEVCLYFLFILIRFRRRK